MFRVMEDKEYRISLEKKLDEEVAEYHESKELEELADILEVVCALCSAQGHSADELMRIYEKSILSAAAFQRGFFCWGRIQE